MSISTSSAPERGNPFSSEGREDFLDTSTDSDSDVDGEPIVDLSSTSTSPPQTAPGEGAFLHFLDGYYIKRQSVYPWKIFGGSCDVFKGDHPTFGKVAMKRPRMSGDEYTESQLRNFKSEANIWKGLSHTNILQFVGMIDTPGQVWLVSVFAENGTLYEYIREHPEVDRCSLVLQLTSGLAYLHDKEVVHGDLKSSNLLVSARRKLLIGDFGLSKLKGMRTASSKKGGGSVWWMAPELLFAANPTKTFLSDVYAYGIIISEIIRGELPFNEYPNDVAFIKAMSPTNSRRPTIPRESPLVKSYDILWAVAEDCWHLVPSERPLMVGVCGRLSLDYQRAVEGVILCSTYETNTLSGLVDMEPLF